MRLTCATLLITSGLVATSLAHAQAPGMGGPGQLMSAPQQSENNARQRAAERDGNPGAEDEDAVLPDPDEDEAAEAYSPKDQPSNRPKTMCEGKKVRTVDVEGNLRVAGDDIRATIKAKRGDTCSDDGIHDDAAAIWNLGFFDDVIILAEDMGQNEVGLVVRVTERPAIGAIVFDGVHELDEEDVDEKVSLDIGEILSVPDVDRQIAKIRDLYAEKGYYLAKVKYALEKMPDNEVRVRFKIIEGEEVTVRSLRFVGNDNLSTDEITGFLRTSETGFFSFVSSNDTFNQSHFDNDLVTVQSLYYDRGYLTVKVGTPRIELTPDRKRIDITIPVEEGPRYRIGRLKIAEVNREGTEIEPLGGRKALRSKVEANPGEWFSRSSLALSAIAITRHYRDRGYAHANIVPRDRIDAKKHIVDITLEIQRGTPVTIERIEIHGNSKTRDKVIRRELKIAEGELYNQTLIERSKDRVTALGYFEHVDLAEQQGSAPDRMVISIDVAERATGTFQVGAGFSSLESFIFTGQIQQQNFLGTGQSFALQLQLSGIRQLIQFQYIEPYLWDSEWTGIAEAFITIRQYNEFTRESQGGALTLGHPILHDDLRLYLRYKLENVDISSRTGGLFSGGNARGLNQLQRLPLANLFRDGLTSSLRLSLVWDSRDNRLFPTNGIYTSVSTEVSDSYLGSANVYQRNELFFRFYKQLWGPFVLKGNFESGLITSRKPDGVPLFERYFLGGIFDVRGYNLQGIVTQAGIPRNNDPGALPSATGVPIGGNLRFFYNLELEFDIVKAVGIKGVLFTDAGNAWNLEPALAIPADLNDSTNDPRAKPNPFNLRHSVGFGVRWISPLGPLRFEWGFPIARRSYEDPLRFEFTIGNFF